jgi:hypothetical protein
MNRQTLNPFLLFGSYAGLMIGLFLSLKGWHIFWWLAALLGINTGSQIAAEAAGGFIAGYILHILIRIFNYHISSSPRSIKSGQTAPKQINKKW